MKPASGTYRLWTPGPNGTHLVWDVVVTDGGATGPLGEEFLWAPGDILVSRTRNLTIECTGNGTGSAAFGTPVQTVEFICAKIG